MALKETKEIPLYIKVNSQDNVAIIVNSGGLKEGTVFPCGLSLEEYVPQGHKVTLTDLAEGEAIVRYGEVIGYAKSQIKKGSWVKESLVKLPTPPELDDLPLATKVPDHLPPLEGYT
ncbi:MAG TPA: UxaA family hydrolase, partial [Metabacillus sp.]|nr:UxaA family hydrolase [Metabacillus sp.]